MLVFLPLHLLVFPAFTQPAGAPSEHDVKAAFLLNFTRFVEWPASRRPNSPFTICIVGDDPFGPAIDRIVEGESVGGRPLAVRRIRELAGGCEMLFVPKSERRTARILAEAGDGVLTVGESDDFLRDGGIIAFTLEERRVRFDVDLNAAHRASLKISSRLLNVARRVVK